MIYKNAKSSTLFLYSNNIIVREINIKNMFNLQEVQEKCIHKHKNVYLGIVSDIFW